MDISKDYYAILGVLPSAETDVIKAVYRTLAKRYHPDTYAGSKAEAEKLFREIGEAYEVLSDPALRTRYDDQRKATGTNFGDFSADRGAKSNRADGEQLDKDWAIAVRVYPRLEELAANLEKLSPSMALAFKIELLETKGAERAEKIFNAMSSEYLRRFFGENVPVRVLARFLIDQQRRDLALELNQMVRVLGSPKDDVLFLRDFLTRHGIVRGYDPETKEFFGWRGNGAPVEQPTGVEESEQANHERDDSFGITIILLFIAAILLAVMFTSPHG